MNSLAVQLFATSSMFGVMWVIQLVHYPMMGGLNPNDFGKWHQFHANRISLLVGPLMALELIGALSLFFAEPHSWNYRGLLGITILVWLYTFVISVPVHNKLSKNGFSQNVVANLVKTNWVRTFLYTLKMALLCWIYYSVSLPAGANP